MADRRRPAEPDLNGVARELESQPGVQLAFVLKQDVGRDAFPFVLQVNSDDGMGLGTYPLAVDDLSFSLLWRKGGIEPLRDFRRKVVPQ